MGSPAKVYVSGIPASDVLFVMSQPVYVCSDGREQVTVHVFTPTGIRSRTARNFRGEWHWQSSYYGERIGWSRPFPLDGESIESLRAWHEREHQWQVIDHVVDESETVNA